MKRSECVIWSGPYVTALVVESHTQSRVNLRVHSLLVLSCIAHRPGGLAVNSALSTLDVFLLVCLFACLLVLSCCAFKSILLPLSFGT